MKYSAALVSRLEGPKPNWERSLKEVVTGSEDEILICSFEVVFNIAQVKLINLCGEQLMYGLVNQAVKEMVVEGHGEAIWEKIRSEAGVVDVFVSMDQYPEDITDKLVKAASAILHLSPSDILAGFGQYWVEFASRNYDYVLDMSGQDFLAFIKNLNNMHARIGLWMPDLKPPSFLVTDEKPGAFKLQYRSSRSGYAPMVKGLLKGLGERFNTDVTVDHARGANQGLDYEEFIVFYAQRTQAVVL